MIKIKICGITKLEDAMACVDLGADAIGFVFTESPRKINRSQCKEIVDRLPPFITTVGLFADQSRKEVDETVKYFHLDVIQFHGEELPKFCSFFNKRIIKAFRLSDKKDMEKLNYYNISAYLLDSYDSKKPGGTGKTFEWEWARGIKDKRIILAGGLTPDNVGEAIRVCSPYGVDVSSGVEISPGIKDHKKIADFIKAVRK